MTNPTPIYAADETDKPLPGPWEWTYDMIRAAKWPAVFMATAVVAALLYANS